MTGQKRYPMCEDQFAQIDCRIEDCIYHQYGKCQNVSPAISLHTNERYFCWSKKDRQQFKINCIDSNSFRDFMRKEGYAIMENDFKKGKLNL